uniref:(California timema) hypothetical protein n=1 Tax=Timema californicum TaxID=61474 RepID=A0A7R9P759_TIMCA|nr:unnamed protein product [Timema californicum]
MNSLEEKTELIFLCEAEDQCAKRTAATFNQRHQDKNISHLVSKLKKKTGSVANIKRTVRTVLNILAQSACVSAELRIPGFIPDTAKKFIIDEMWFSPFTMIINKLFYHYFLYFEIFNLIKYVYPLCGCIVVKNLFLSRPITWFKFVGHHFEAIKSYDPECCLSSGSPLSFHTNVDTLPLNIKI